MTFNTRVHSSVGQVDADGRVSIDCIAGPAGRWGLLYAEDAPNGAPAAAARKAP